MRKKKLIRILILISIDNASESLKFDELLPIVKAKYDKNKKIMYNDIIDSGNELNKLLHSIKIVRYSSKNH